MFGRSPGAPPTIKLSDRGRADARRARPRAPAPRTTTPNSSARRRFEINFASSKGRHELAQMGSKYQQHPYCVSEMGTFFGMKLTQASINGSEAMPSCNNFITARYRDQD